MLDFIFDAGFDGLLVGKSGEASRARRSEKTLDEFDRTGTVTFPGARCGGGKAEAGYLTIAEGSIVFSQVSGSAMTHVDIDLEGLQSFWAMSNEGRVERSVNRYWTLFRLRYASGEVVLASSPNGHSSLLSVLVAAGVPQLQPEGWEVDFPQARESRPTRGLRKR